uniref:Uncharacterized protein n=1 Tax=Panagrolaimus sp. ES5 TaxID=591445 RepID=A0AC34FGH9_9BILA
MKQIYLFFLLFITIKFVASVEYHGNRKHWTLEKDEKTYIALHILKEEQQSFHLTFPKQKALTDLLSGIKLHSLSKCQDTTNTLNFTLTIADQNYIRGEVKVVVVGQTDNLKAFLYETCGTYTSMFISPPIDVIPAALEDRSRVCFRGEAAPFRAYEKDNTKYVLELHASGGIGCQVFMELPSYMEVEDFTLPDAPRLVLNESFAENNETFWWKSENDQMLPSAVTFDGSGNVQINISKSIKKNPYFFRIGQNQPLPSLQFQFDAQCSGFKFEMFLNLQDSPECKMEIHVITNGLNISTKNGIWHEIKDPSFSPTLVFGQKKVYAKVASPLSIKEFETCDFKTSPDVAADQFVLQLARDKSSAGGECVKGQIIIPQNDFAAGIEVLINRARMEKNTTENETIAILPINTTPGTSAAGMEWWWFLIMGGV